MKRTTLVIVISAVLLLIAGVFAAAQFNVIGRWQSYQADREREKILAQFSEETFEAPIPQTENVDVPTLTETIDEQPPPESLPERVLLDVQFIPQGPLDPGPAHWDLHAESCEEAAAIMAHNYLVGKTVTMQQAEDEIFALINWQVEHFGEERDIYADEEAEMLRGFYGHTDVRVLRDVTVDDLKRELAAGRPVIVPGIAAPLNNPRYPEQGYHMFVLVGYTADHFIANDNGTTWGEDYPYPYDAVMESLGQVDGDVVVIHK